MSGFFLPCSIGSVTGPAALETVVRVRNQILVPPNGVAQIPPGCLPCETTKPWPPHYRTQRKVLTGRDKDLRTQGRTLCVSPSLRTAPTQPDKMPPPSGNSQQGKTFCLCWLQEARKSEKCGPVKGNPPGNIHSSRHSRQKSLGKLPYSSRSGSGSPPTWGGSWHPGPSASVQRRAEPFPTPGQ